MTGFLIGLSIGLGIAVVVHIYHTKIKAAVQAELTKVKADLSAAVAKLPK